MCVTCRGVAWRDVTRRIPEPQRLKCNLTPELTQSINAAYKHNLEAIANLELTMVE